MLTLTSLIHRAQKTACKYILNDAPILLYSSTIRSDAKPAKNAASKFSHLLRGLSLASALVLGCTMALADDYVFMAEFDADGDGTPEKHFVGADGTANPTYPNCYLIGDFPSFSPNLIWKVVDYPNKNPVSLSTSPHGIPLLDFSDSPEGFRKLEYIESNGAQFIRTGVNTGTGIELRYKFSISSLSNNYQSICAARVNGYSNSISQGIHKDNWYYAFGTNSEDLTTPPSTNVFYEVIQNNEGYYIDGTQHVYPAGQNILFDTPLELVAFGRNNNGTMTASLVGKIAYLQIYNEGELIRDFIPVKRNSDSKVGLFDLVSNTFFENNGTGSFSPGPEAGIVRISQRDDYAIGEAMFNDEPWSSDSQNNLVYNATNKILYHDGSTSGHSHWVLSGLSGHAVSAYQVLRTDIQDYNLLPSLSSSSVNVGSSITVIPSTSGIFRPEYYSFNGDYYYSTDGNNYIEVSTIPASVSNYEFDYTVDEAGAAYVEVSNNTIVCTTNPDHDVLATLTVSSHPTGYDYPIKIQKLPFQVLSNTPSSPIINMDLDGHVEISSVPGAVIHYTTDGSAPTSSSTKYESRLDNIQVGTTIKAIAYKDGYSSDITTTTSIGATGIAGSSVILDDREDHTWSYYKANGGIDATYGYPSQLCSPDPRNVKITYIGNGIFADNDADNTGNPSGVQVSITETENTFVYYKTLEKGSDGKYAYSVIPNPFTKRPSRIRTGDTEKTYYGCRKWKVTALSGGTITDSSGNNVPMNGFIDADTDIKFTPTSSYSTNCISMEVELSAYWEVAVRTEINDANYSSGSFPPYGTASTESRDLNFRVYKVANASGGKIQINSNNYPVTFMMVEPDGSADYRDATLYPANWIYSITVGSGAIRVENAVFNFPMNGTKPTFDNSCCLQLCNGSAKCDVYLGRGISSRRSDGYCIQSIRGYNTGTIQNMYYRFRLESGKYVNYDILCGEHLYSGNITIRNDVNIHPILGCDYDRARQDNTKLIITKALYGGCGISLPSKNIDIYSLLIKSGNILSEKTPAEANAEAGESLYTAISNNTHKIIRHVTIEGGILNNISGGYDELIGYEDKIISLDIRMKGGLIRGSVGIGAATATAYSSRRMIMTGGQIKGWLCGGCIGKKNHDGGGILYGASFLYVGGYGKIDSEGSTTYISTALGGNVFGGGCGTTGAQSTGEMVYGTNVVVSDNAFVERDVYGGGNYGFADQTANVFVLGGVVGGNVFGGANQNKGQHTNVIIAGGEVRKGVYGGSNTTGTLSGNSSVRVISGIVGTSGKTANIHGGGYGAPTKVTGNISVSIGNEPSSSNKTVNKDSISSLIIYGDVYGGSALGQTNTGTAATRTTAVKMYSGTVNGNIYGGALGSVSSAAQIKATAQTVDIYGGKVTGGVYGGSNINASMTAAVKPRQGVTIHNTWTPTTAGQYAIGSVFGGGNGETAAGSGQPGAHDSHADGTFVTVDSGYVGNIFGGGNAATAKKTTVTVNDGTVGNIYGGSNKADIDGLTSITVNGGKVMTGIYGGCNTQGNVNGTTNVNILGGTIGTDSILANVHGGGFGQVTTTGSDVTVNVGALSSGHGSTTGPSVYADVYGGSALGSVGAVLTDTAYVNIYSGSVYGNVYGGGLGRQDDTTTVADESIKAVVSGSTLVSVYKAHFGPNSEIFGGNNLNGSPVGSTTVHVYETEVPAYTAHIGENQSTFPGESTDNPWNQYAIKGVYGGSNKALFHTVDAPGQTNVIVDDCASSIAYVYGGSNAADVYGSTAVTINGAGKIGVVFGGGNGAGEGNPGANVLKGSDNSGGNTVTNIYGGVVDFTFGGSNTLGDVKGTATVNLEDNSGACSYLLGEVYGAGNAAPMTGSPDLNIGCIDSIGSIYGGARNADLSSDVTLNIHNGKFSKIFGGNNLGGTLSGAITINIEETGCSPIRIDELYGCGNMAAYTTPSGKADPQINIKSATYIGAVYGGGLGSSATVTGSPVVDINMEAGTLNKGTSSAVPQSMGAIGNVFGGGNAAVLKGNSIINLATTSGKDAPITGNVYGGGNLAEVQGNTTINAAGGSAAKIFGGGNGDAANSKAANVTGNTSVLLTGTAISGGLYGGCNAMGTVSGNTSLSLTGGSVGTSALAAEGVFGGGYGQSTDVNGNVNVLLNGTPVYGDVYGGSALGSVGSDNSDSIRVTLNGSSVSGNIYGGGLGDNTAGSQVAAQVNGKVLVSVTDGSASNVFGCNNLYGAPADSVKVTVTGGTVTDNIYGGGNQAAASVSPAVYIHGGSMKNVYGGGLGSTAVITGSPAVYINQAVGSSMSVKDVFGGGDAASVTGNPIIYLSAGTIRNAFGGGNQAGIDGSTTVNLKGTNVTDSIYGGCNTSGTVSKSTTISLTAGSVGGSVFGGGFGSATDVDSLSTITLNGDTVKVTHDIYGGSALGQVTATTVTLTKGTVGGDVYGGGLGNATYAAAVHGNVKVTADGASVGGSIYGCNNANGSPDSTSTVQVDINVTPDTLKAVYGGGNVANSKVKPIVNINSCDVLIGSVYGGGNAAATAGTNTTIWGGTIGSAFGGGNGTVSAANVNGNSLLTIHGGTITSVYAGSNTQGVISGTMGLNIDHVGKNGTDTCTQKIGEIYGGGNKAEGNGAVITIGCGTGYLGNVYGGSRAAKVNGSLTLNIEGGQIDNVFGGNNESGDITGNITVNIKTGDCKDAVIKNVYGGGNLAAFNHNTTVNLISGKVGTLASDGVTVLGGNVFGGGYGKTAKVTGSTTVNLCSDSAKPDSLFRVLGSIYGGGDLAPVEGNTTLNLTKGITKYAFGGGNLATVTGRTSVTLNGDSATVTSDIYGGGSLASVLGSTTVTTLKGKVGGSVYGGGLGNDTIAANVRDTTYVNINGGTISVNVFGSNNVNGAPGKAAKVNVMAGTVTGNVYGGGNLAAAGTKSAPVSPAVTVTGGSMNKVYGGGLGQTAVITGNPTVTINKAAISTMTVTDVFGGGDAAQVTGNPVIYLTAGQIANAFGGGNEAAVRGLTTVNAEGGTAARLFGGGNKAGIEGSTTVNLKGTNVTDSIYGGCNTSGTVTKSTTVNLTAGSVSGSVFGGGFGAATDVDSISVITLNGATASVTHDIYGGSALGSVSGTAVTVTKGSVGGSVYGGGLGDATHKAAVNDDVLVTVNGGKISGNVYGCNNVNGAPSDTSVVRVVVSATQDTLKAVFGGGNMASYTGTPHVSITTKDALVGKVFGGGNAADVSGTDVTIWGGTVGDAFAGGNGVVSGTAANVTGNALLTIHGGTIGRAFAGSNNNGSISGTDTVKIDQQKYGSNAQCVESVSEVYGGGNLAAGKAGVVSLDCSADSIGDVYGGANQADITNDIVLNITKGRMKRVFGGNNTSGNIEGSITVNIKKDDGCSDFRVVNVYGGGNLADYTAPTTGSYTGNYPAVNILAGTVSEDVFGGGLKAMVTGTPTVSISGGTVSRDVYGGGSLAAVTGKTSVTLASGTVTGNIYGGGLGDNTTAADVSDTTRVYINGGSAANVFGCNNVNGAPQKGAKVYVSGGTVNAGVFGGGNLANANVNPQVTISGGTMDKVFGGGNQASADSTTITVTGGTVTTGVYGGCNATGTAASALITLTDGTIGSVFGGGYGEPTVVSGNVDVNIGTINAGVTSGTATITGDVYGGSALGTVGISGVKTNHTNVTLNAGSVGGSLYGGGLGRKADSGASPAVSAVEAKVYSPVQVTMNGGTISGDIFGCNNLNGAPQDTVRVDINATADTVNAVYGGGNLAAYSRTPAVSINDCGVLIRSVYGGGNAAATGGTNATIWGGTIGNAFGGGNGESGTAADVNGNSRLNLYGGTITNAFAGSNKTGQITGTMKLQIGGAPAAGPCSCDLKVTNTYGGGNQAASQGAEITIGCGAGYLGNVYGGAKAADISGGLTLNIEGGQIDNVFGGNDQSGEIGGNITVNINTGSCTTSWIKNVYGGGNMAAFGHNTTVNLISGTVGKYDTDGVTLLGGNVFGGGYGNTATVTGNTTVNLCSDAEHPTTLFSVLGRIYGGGDLASVEGNITLNLTKGTTAYAFGGGNKADVTGKTSVTLNGDSATVTSDLYGGGSLASVTDSARVSLVKGTVGGNVYGGGLGQKDDPTTTGVDESVAANVGTAKVEVNGATAGNVFGCNNVNGAPQTAASVTVSSGTVTGNVYGGGNLAAASLSPSVSLTGGTVTGDVFGAGLGASAVITGDPTVTVNGGTVSSDVYGGGSQASVAGNTSVAMTTGSVGGNIYGGGLGKTAVGDSIAANVSGTATVNVNGGTVTGSVFGCNNLLGAPAGTATVTVDMASGSVGGNVYGGGNQAAYTGDATVYLTRGTVAKAFGGGYGATAIVTGDPTVNLTGATVGNVFGGGDEASLIGNPQLSVSGGQATQIFGGGNKALVTGDPAVSVTGGTHGTVFGGGNEANVTGTPTVTVKGDSTRITGNVFGGGNQGNVSGSPTVTIGE